MARCHCRGRQGESVGRCVLVGPVPTSWTGTIPDVDDSISRESRGAPHICHLDSSLSLLPTKANRLVTSLYFALQFFLLAFIAGINLCARLHSLFDLARVVYHSFVDVSLCPFFAVTAYVCVETVSVLMELLSNRCASALVGSMS